MCCCTDILQDSLQHLALQGSSHGVEVPDLSTPLSSALQHPCQPVGSYQPADVLLPNSMTALSLLIREQHTSKFIAADQLYGWSRQADLRLSI